MLTQSVANSSPQSRKSTENLNSVRISSKPHSSPQKWQNRERLLALSETKGTCAAKSTSATKEGGRGRFLLHASASTSNTASSPSAHAQNVLRMGLRVNEKKMGRHASTCNSEQSLPEKLSHALKALRPSALSHSSNSSSPFKSKSSSFVVATDDLVYYPGSDHTSNKRFSTNLAQANQHKGKLALTKPSPSQTDLHQIGEISSLEQIKQLYKSVPNINSVDEAHPMTVQISRRSPCRSKNESRFITNRAENRGSSPFLAKSPTDSGYRSAPRHLSSLTGKIATGGRREHFLKSSTKHQNNSEPNGAHFSVNEKKMGRHASTCNSEQSLPEKLSHALKALRPSALSHSSNSSSPFKSKSSSFVVATDDLVYYPGSDHTSNKRFSTNLAQANQHKGKLALTKPSPSQTDLHQIGEISSLEQIKQLYKSVPNINSVDEAHPMTVQISRRSPCRSKNESRFITNRAENRGSSPFLAKSPTDSGYRSAPRHLSSLTGKIATGGRREHFLKSSTKHQNNSEPNGAHFSEENSSEGRIMHEPTVVLINGESLDTTVVHRRTEINSLKDSDRLSCRNLDDYDYPREATCSSVGSTSGATYDTVPIQTRFGQFPFDEKDIITALKRGRCKEYGDLINATVIPRLAAYLGNPLHRLANEIKRLSAPLTKCTPLDIKTATKVVLSENVADSCIKAGIQATSIYALSGTGALKLSMSRRAGLHFNLGRFYRWMIESQISRAVSDGAAVYLCAVMECLLEETVRACFTSRGGKEMLTAQSFDEVMKGKRDLCEFFATLERTRKDVKRSSAGHECELPADGGSFCVRSEAELRSLIEGLTSGSNAKNSDGTENQKFDFIIFFNFYVVLSENVADSCIKAGIQATSIYALSGTGALKLSMSRRAGLHFNLGRFYRWMIESQISRAVSDGAAVYLCAVMECLLEETVRACFTSRGGKEMLTAQSFDEVMKGKRDLCEFFATLERTRKDVKRSSAGHECELPADGGSFCVRSEAELRSLIEGLTSGSNAKNSDGTENQKIVQCSFTKDGLAALLYYTRCGKGCEKGGSFGTRSTSEKRIRQTLLDDWYRVATAFATHRLSQLIDEEDVRQSARTLLPNADCPPRTVDFHARKPMLCAADLDQCAIRRQLGFRILQMGNAEFVDHALTLLGPLKYRTVNEFGLSPLAEAIVMGNEKAISLLLSVGADVNSPVPAESPSKASQSTVLIEFAGWTPLTWAVAREDAYLVKRIIEACADVENAFMIRETPLQLAAMMDNFDIVVKLLNSGGNPFHTSISYDSLKCNFRNTGSPSAIAVAAAHGHRRALRAMIFTATNSKRADEIISLKDFLEESDDTRDTGSVGSVEKTPRHSSMFMDTFSKEQQRALHEALYYSAETGHLEIALDLRKIGVPWNVYTWVTCLRLAGEQRLRSSVSHLLGDFNSRLSDEISHDTIDEVVSELFEILHFECSSPDGDPTPVASIISRLFKQFRFGATSDDINEINEQHSNIIHRPAIDLKYVDNVELSDIRFLVEKRVVYAHRIVLVNSSDVFKKLLDSPKGQVEIDNIPYDIFKLLMQCLYSGNYSSALSNKPLRKQMDLIEAARRFGINALIAESRNALRPQISRETIIDIYKFVTRCSLGPLIVDCEMFILERLSSLINDARLRTMLGRSGQSGWPDYGAGLASSKAETQVGNNLIRNESETDLEFI
ncbi:Ankyrin repeat and BTB/POZ domain-containing protein 2 [Toxocara canis]|uniref:Ankyrin repeat and BTB/POZ domain-containing protein 2 n=1 Tax=Toxocara canis TaxID=6265 RepID=A0A0B2VNT1_TOXCA|nr:Ankyrin repeat and BTB/POZ domain-containing protein 2 [Toxocara canis]